MFTNKEILEYGNLLYNLNEKKKTLPKNYTLIMTGGGKDHIQHFKLLSNSVSRTYVIWVRGTRFTKLNDIGINISSTPVDFYDSKCHSGYLHSAIGIINLIKDHLSIQANNKLVCLGHSLGGAISSVLATIFTKGNWGTLTNIDEIQKKFTGGIRALIFGTPPTFSRNINQETKNYITGLVIDKDIVPRLGTIFDSLQTISKMILLLGFIQYKAIKFKSDTIDVLRIFKAYIQSLEKCDRTPGNVIVINNSSLSFMGNHRTIQSSSDYLGILHHSYIHYWEAIQKFVDENDEVFLKAKIIKNQLQEQIDVPQNKSSFLLLYSKIGQNLLQISMDQKSKNEKLKDNKSSKQNSSYVVVIGTENFLIHEKNTNVLKL